MSYDKKEYRERREPLHTPKRGGSVWPRQSCPELDPRRGHHPIEGSQCWFCRYADFRLTCPVALEVGICCYPDLQIY